MPKGPDADLAQLQSVQGEPALDLESRRQGALARCFERVKKALSPRTDLRFLQVEHQLLLIVDLQMPAALPVAK